MILKNQTMIYKNQTMILRIIAYLATLDAQCRPFYSVPQPKKHFISIQPKNFSPIPLAYSQRNLYLCTVLLLAQTFYLLNSLPNYHLERVFLSETNNLEATL